MIAASDNLESVEYEEESEHKKPISLQDWKNSPTVEELSEDIRNSQSDFDIHTTNVRKYLNLRDAKVKVKIPKGRSVFQPKLVRKQAEWRYSSLESPFLSSKDLFDVEPETYNDKQDAVDNAKVLNKQFNKDMDRIEFIGKYIRTAVDEGLVVVRTGWEYKEEIRLVEQPEKQMVPITQDPQEMQRLQIAVQSGQMDPKDAMQEVETGQMIQVEQMVPVINRPTVDVVDYDKFMIDANSNGDLEKCRFVAYQFKSSYSQLSDMDKYSNLDVMQIGASDILGMSDEDIDDASNFKDKARKEFWVTEYWGDWDIHGDNTTVPIVATFVGTTMIGLEENPFPDKEPPFVLVKYLPVRDATYPGEPDAVLIAENQDIIGATTRGMLDLMGRSANAQQGISVDALDAAQKIRFEQGKDYLFNPGIDPSKAFYMATFPEIPRSAMEILQMQNSDAESLTGKQAFSNGMAGEALGATATGIRSSVDAASKRELGVIRRMSKGIVEIGKKISAMNAVNLDDQEIQRITDGEIVSLNHDPDSIDYDLEISISTPEKDNEKAQDLAFMLQTIGNGMDPELQQIILSDIATLKDMPVLSKKLIDYQPQPDPQDQKIKELQIALLEAQVINEQAKGKENQADVVEKTAQADLNTAKADTERAKVRSLNSDSDMTDLSFLQEKAGTKHNQAIEMEKERQANNMEDKVVDAALDRENPNIGGYKPSKPDEVSKYPSQNVPVIDMPAQNLGQQTGIDI